MTIKNTINQLYELRAYCRRQMKLSSGGFSDVWADDVSALGVAIDFLMKSEAAEMEGVE